MNAKEVAYTGLLCALAAVLGYVEALLPPFVPVSGFKIGLSNIAVMYALYRIGKRRAFFVILVKVLVTSLWFSGLNTLIYSLFGGVAAYFAMLAALRLKMSHYGVGMCGGVFHNMGQLAAACIVLKTTGTLSLAPALLILGLAAGWTVGLAARLLLRATEKIVI